VLKLAFRRKSTTAMFATIADMQDEDEWDTLKAATDATKVIVTPIIAGFKPEPGKAKEVGSGNEVPFAIPIQFGTDPTKVTLRIWEASAETIRALKALQCESLEVVLINELGFFGHSVDAATKATVFGFPVYSFHVQDKNMGGAESADYHEISFSLPANWSDYFTITEPDGFNGLDL